MIKLIIFGTDKYAEVVYAYMRRSPDYQIVGFTVDRRYLHKNRLFDLPVHAFEDVDKIWSPADHEMIIAVAYANLNKSREAKFLDAKMRGYRLASYVDPSTLMFEGTSVGENTIILDHNTIQPYAQIGHNVIIWTGNIIGHHSVIGDHCCITSQVAIGGNTEVGTNCFFGVNATIRDGLHIGSNCLIGLGCLIGEDAPPGSVYRASATPRSRVPSDRVRNI